MGLERCPLSTCDDKSGVKEWCLLGCYAVWFLQEPHGVTTQKTPFFIVTAVKTLNLTMRRYFKEK
jgi:hypothetical protein